VTLSSRPGRRRAGIAVLAVSLAAVLAAPAAAAAADSASHFAAVVHNAEAPDCVGGGGTGDN
jgi:hypothetical protein